MWIQSHHERIVSLSLSDLTARMHSLATTDDQLWPRRWPRMRLDRGLVEGSAGGHGPIRYSVDHYLPGREIQFRFDPSVGLSGVHRFQFEPVETGVRVSHTLLADPSGWMRVAWPVAIRWLHDALIEDALDQLASPPHVRPFTPWVRALRRGLSRR